MSRRDRMTRDRAIETAVDLAVGWAREVQHRKLNHHQRYRRRRKRRRRTFFKVLRAILLIALATFLLVPAMIAGGFFYGALKGLVAAPLILLATWGAILWWTFGRKQELKAVAVQADLSKLPEQTEEWLEQHRELLPRETEPTIDNLIAQLETLTPQLEGLDPQQPAAVELRRLIAEELPDLVRTYRRVPRRLQQQASHGGSSPERQLVEGLATIDQQLMRIHERLAAEDLRALATHERYLELKYKGDKLK